jgi:hypothetical protein
MLPVFLVLLSYPIVASLVLFTMQVFAVL